MQRLNPVDLAKETGSLGYAEQDAWDFILWLQSQPGVYVLNLPQAEDAAEREAWGLLVTSTKISADNQPDHIASLWLSMSENCDAVVIQTIREERI